VPGVVKNTLYHTPISLYPSYMICLLYGENEFAIQLERNRLISTYLGDNDPFGLERLDGQDLSVNQLRDSVLQLPFLVSKKLVVLSGAFSDKAITQALTDLIENIPDSIDLVMVDPKPDKRTKLFKFLQSKRYTKEFQPLKGSALQTWVTEYARMQNSDISAEDASYLIDRVGTDQMLLAREIEKLAYVPSISRSEIDSLTEPALSASVFELLDLAFSGKSDRAQGVYDVLLANKTDPSEIMGLIAWQLHAFALVKSANSLNSSDVSSKTGLHPFVVGKAIRVVEGITTQQIKTIVAKATQVDELIKTGKADPEDALRILLLDLSSL
jgi:DNA polymerase III subunit delta